MIIRTLIDAKPRDYGYTVTEYNLQTGAWKHKIFNAKKTPMRITGDNRFEANGTLVSQKIFDQWFVEYQKIHAAKGFTVLPLPGQILEGAVIHKMD